MKANRVLVFAVVFSVIANVALLILLVVNGWRQEADRYRRSYSNALVQRVHKEIEGVPAYLLSGSPDEAQQISGTHRELQNLIERHSMQMKTPIDAEESEKLGKDEKNWYAELATSLMEMRKQVDSGKSTFADLQMAYLQKDPTSYNEVLRRDLEAIQAKLK